MVNKSQYIQQIDIIKGLAIILVIFGHTFLYLNDTQNNISLNSQGYNKHIEVLTISTIIQNLNFTKIFTHWITYSALSTQQVVPIFIAIMAFNFALSYKRKGFLKITDLYSKREFLSRFRRFLVPFIIIYIVELVFGVIYYLFMHKNILFLNTAFLPIDGPGRYFISIVFQFILLYPVIYLIYRKYPKLLIVTSFIIALLFELITSNIPYFTNHSVIYLTSITRFLPLIVLSLWISDDYNLFSKRNSFIIILSILSIVYLIIINQFPSTVTICKINFVQMFESQNMFASFYEILLFMIGLKYIPVYKTMLFKIFALFGKSSFHIFLVQIFYFGIIDLGIIPLSVRYSSISGLLSVHNIILITINLLICIIVGCLFYNIENKNKFLSEMEIKIDKFINSE
jgi:fucose 4-O-acetylase-like acetyltransferase